MATTAESATTEVKKMNPPSALHGAMSRDRKPFTYTPGGLDLSEIKSERMAKRLMRNAMNQGVPDLPAQAAQSPSTLSAPIAVPNFNCLPVQVFPTFQLPANPKSLLRTRSTPDKSREPQPSTTQNQPQHLNNFKPSGIVQSRETLNNNTPLHMQVNNNIYNNGSPARMYEYGTAVVSSSNITGDARNYQSDLLYTKPALPEMCYDAEYFQVQPKYSDDKQTNRFALPVNAETEIKLHVEENLKTLSSNEYIVQPLYTDNGPAPVVIKPVEDNAVIDVDDEQKEVKVVKKQVKKKVESQNGEQNGESEAEMTVKLPTKKSAAKTETKVEVIKKVLPDGSVEEIKTTTTKTTIDGKTEITTKIETHITPKEDEEEVEEIEEEEEEEEENEETVVQEHVEEPTTIVIKNVATQPTVIENESVKNDSIIKKDETSEITTTKKVVIIQNSNKDEKEEEEDKEEYEEEEEIEPVVEKTLQNPQQTQEKQSVSEQVAIKQEPVLKQEQRVETLKSKEDEEKKEKEVVEVHIEKKEINTETSTTATEYKKDEEEEYVEEEEEFEEAEEIENKPGLNLEKQPDLEKEKEKEEEEESEYTEEEIESEKEEISPPEISQKPAQSTNELEKEEPKKETPQEPELEEKKEVPQEQPVVSPVDPKIPFREPSIPLEKVEDVEIKPIGASSETVSKTHTASTEIIKSDNDLPKGTLSTQTEYNRIENIVTVNRTTKTLDHNYEQLTQKGVPTVKTYFAPDRERVSTSPQPAKPYQPVYPPKMQQQPERRHSLLLERLSTERQMPSEIYQNNYPYNNQSSEQQKQWSQEPQAEVINVSNVKPSTITNQQWYQQSRKENVIYNNVIPTSPAAPDQQWAQSQPESQPQAQPQTQYQPTYTENINQDSSRSISNNYQQNSYPTYAPTPSNWATTNIASTIPSINTQTNQYSFFDKESSETYQKTTQQYSSSYVPPPWEQDPGYVAPALPVQNYYQAPPSSSSFSPSSKPGWKPTPPAAGKFSKPVATSYVPPAPNQSFVVPVSTNVEPPRQPGRRTYYSEYERRYITVPESTYIPSETKFQPQPDPSPQYYYDNNEPSETVEPQWRKELREFTEKTSQTQQQTEQTSVKPPWEDEPKYVKVPTVTYTPTPSWSQTLRPQSHRERSFESEFVESNEWSKTSTLGRSRPLSSYGNNIAEAPIPERTRGVSVDRYNPNNYQSPITTEHSPVQTHTLNPQTAPHGYHNPNVPAYHTRASAEPREHSAIPQPRNWGEARASPLQSRSFKYLQWITGTED